MPVEHPICEGLVLCDLAIIDARTGKKSLIGCFRTIVSENFPARHPSFCILVMLTNCLGRVEIGVEIARDVGPEEEVIMSLSNAVESASPLDAHELVLDIHGLPLPDEGFYRINVHLLPQRMPLMSKMFQAQRPRTN